MEGGGTWGGQRVGFRIDKIEPVSQLLNVVAFCPQRQEDRDGCRLACRIAVGDSVRMGEGRRHPWTVAGRDSFKPLAATASYSHITRHSDSQSLCPV